LTETKLFKQITLGDKEAFDQLFHLNYKSLCRFALTFVEDADESEEIVQKIFVRLWENRKKLIIPNNTKSFLFKSVYFECLKFFRQKQIHEKYISKYVKYINTNTDDKEDYTAFLPHLYTAIEKLPKKCQQIFILNKIEGLTQKEVSEYLEISVKTVENQITIAISKLREELKPFLHLLPATVLFFILY
jgi:RNA polymerase sigma-70 factor (ECF subfamily)